MSCNFGAFDDVFVGAVYHLDDKHFLWLRLAGWWGGALVLHRVRRLASCATGRAAGGLAALVLVGDGGAEGIDSGDSDLRRICWGKYSRNATLNP